MDRRPDLGAERPRQRQELDRVAGRLEGPVERLGSLDDLRVRRVAGDGDPGDVALDVGHEDGDARLRQLAGEELKGLRLARAGRPGDQAVASHHRQRDLDASVVGELAVEHRAADDEAGLGQGVALAHLVVEGLIHGLGSRWAADFRGGPEAYHRPPVRHPGAPGSGREEAQMLSEFRGFLLKTNALALAIGVIIGGALGTVVNSLVNDIIMPPVGLVLGGVDFTQLKIVLKAAANGDPATEVAIRWGTFLNAIIAFIVIALVVWRISQMFIKEPPPAEVKTCSFCKEPNAVDASKCRACASAI